VHTLSVIHSAHEGVSDTSGPAWCTARALRVLVVTNMYPYEGDPAFGTFVMQQVDHLRRAGQSVSVLHIRGHESKFRYLKAAVDVFAQTRRASYDVVHAHYGLSGVPALFRSRTPLVVTLHGSDALSGVVEPFVSQMVCKLADKVIVVSNEIRKRISGELIPCGIDLERFVPGDRVAARAKLNLPLNRRFILFPYDRHRKVKRFDLAQAAVDRLGARDVECLAVSRVRNEEMPWYYRASDAMILCSESEGSPTSVKEALACNIPVVSTNVGDVAEILRGIDGCELCEAAPEPLAVGLRRVLNSQRAFNGRTAMRRYDHRQVVEALLRVYRSALEGRSATGR
jgi:teichuronic acid biosynthesis glycosyltransferase TuaC